MSRLEGEAWLRSPQKRRFDKLLCVALAAPVGAIALPAAGLIRWIDRMEPIFRQKRYGNLVIEPFEILKFQTMPPDTPQTVSEGKHDSRATPLGTVLRRSHVDELPQFLNVWRGDMTFVGPRPQSLAAVNAMLDVLTPAEQRQLVAARKIAKPGLADPYSAYAYRRQDGVDYRDMALAQIEFAHSATFRTDLEILHSAALVAMEGALGAQHDVSAESSAA